MWGRTRIQLALFHLGRQPPGLALLAGTNLAQEFPGIDAQLVSVVPMKLDRIFAHALGRQGLDRGLEHGKCPGRQGWRISGFAPALGALIIAQGAGAGVAQECERVVRTMAVFPIDVHARAGREIYFDRFGICRARHESQYRTNPEGSRDRARPGLHSQRRASIGSTWVARLAGIQLAPSVAVINTSAMARKTAGVREAVIDFHLATDFPWLQIENTLHGRREFGSESRSAKPRVSPDTATLFCVACKSTSQKADAGVPKPRGGRSRRLMFGSGQVDRKTTAETGFRQFV